MKTRSWIAVGLGALLMAMLTSNASAQPIDETPRASDSDQIVGTEPSMPRYS